MFKDQIMRMFTTSIKNSPLSQFMSSQRTTSGFDSSLGFKFSFVFKELCIPLRQAIETESTTNLLRRERSFNVTTGYPDFF